MCYHTSSPSKDKLKDRLGAEYTIEPYPEKHFVNGFDFPLIPAILNTDAHHVQPITWGFLPPKTPDKKSKKSLNARNDKLFESFQWKHSAQKRRCLIFADGYYEWKPIENQKWKDPYYIEMPDKEPFAIGGIWKQWPNEDIIRSAMITTEADELNRWLRPETPRMPFIIPREHWDVWLSYDAKEAELIDLMQPLQDGILKAVKLDVSPLKRG